MANFLGEMFSAFVAQGLPKELWEQIRPWASRFGSHVLERCGPVVAGGQACAHVARSGSPCPRLAVCECRGCGETVCLNHAYVKSDATAICIDCVAAFTEAARADERAQARKQARGKGKGRSRRRWAPPPPPPPFGGDAVDPAARARRRALGVLGLDDSATFADVQARFRAMSREHHPDRFVDPVQKAEAEVRFKRISEAYHYLQRTRTAA